MKRENSGLGDIPLGLGMALAQNPAAMKTFAELPKERREAGLAQAGAVKAKAEMRRLVAGLAENSSLPLE